VQLQKTKETPTALGIVCLLTNLATHCLEVKEAAHNNTRRLLHPRPHPLPLLPLHEVALHSWGLNNDNSKIPTSRWSYCTV